jgi:hypothetical protein
MGFGDENQTEQAHGPHDGGADADLPGHDGDLSHEGTDAGLNHGDDVLDVDVSPKKKSKAGIYAGVILVGILVLAVVGTIFSKVMAVMSPASGPAEGVVSTPAGDIRPLEGAQAPSVALPGGAFPVEPAASPGQSSLAAAPAAIEPGSSQPVDVAQPSLAGAPVAACAPVAAVSCPDTSAKDREIAALKSDLDAANSRVADLESKLKKPVASKPAATPKVAPSASRVASGQNKVVRGKFEGIEEKKEAVRADEARAMVEATPAVQPARAMVRPQDVAPLTGYRLRAIYPNTGDHKSAHLVDPAGKNVVVRVGDVLRTGARVLRINVEEWRVVTTDGEIL